MAKMRVSSVAELVRAVDRLGDPASEMAVKAHVRSKEKHSA
jgi:hypothetical protein